MLEKQLWKMREDQTTEEMGEPKTNWADDSRCEKRESGKVVDMGTIVYIYIYYILEYIYICIV